MNKVDAHNERADELNAKFSLIVNRMIKKGINAHPLLVNINSRAPKIMELKRGFAKLAKKEGHSLPEIAWMLGYKDHSTVVNLLNPEKRKKIYKERVKPKNERKYGWNS